MKLTKKIGGILATGALLAGIAAPTAFAAPGAQGFDVYDNTNDGLQVGTDSDTGNVVVNANPGGQSRLIVQAHLQKAAPNCTYNVELVRASSASNGGLDGTGHTGSPTVIGTLTTNGGGNGNAHFDVDLGTDPLDTDVYAHLDFEAVGTCTEADGTNVVANEYGAAPDPALGTPLTFKD